MLKPEEDQKKPVFKFNPNFKKTTEISNGTMESPLEQMEALKKNLEDRTRYSVMTVVEFHSVVVEIQ